MKKLVLRVHTQRVLLEGLYHKASMGFKWQTLTKVLRNKPSCFVDSYKIAPIYISLQITALQRPILIIKTQKINAKAILHKRALAFIGKNHHAASVQNAQQPFAGFLLRFPKRHRQLLPQDALYHLVEVGIHSVDLPPAALLLGLLLPQLLE